MIVPFVRISRFPVFGVSFVPTGTPVSLASGKPHPPGEAQGKCNDPLLADGAVGVGLTLEGDVGLGVSPGVGFGVLLFVGLATGSGVLVTTGPVACPEVEEVLIPGVDGEEPIDVPGELPPLHATKRPVKINVKSASKKRLGMFRACKTYTSISGKTFISYVGD